MKLNGSSLKLASALLLSLTASVAAAANFSFNSQFVQDDEYQFLSFQADGVSTVTLETTAYAAGGFDPMLTLLQPSGLVISVIPLNPGDVFEKPYVAAAGWDDKELGVLMDSFFEGVLDAGVYWLALTQSMNPVNGKNNNYYTPATGFVQQGNYTGALNGCADVNEPFCNFLRENRLGDWALSIGGVVSAQTESAFNPPPPPDLPTKPLPEPSSIGLAGLGLAILRIMRYFKQFNHH